MEKLKRVLDREREEVIQISKQIFANPELGLEERFASSIMCDYLTSKGFAVTKGAAGLETSYIASYESGEGGYHIAFCAEYDALPEIGHACGHNLIGMASVAAGVILAEGLKAEGVPFRVSVIGTPDEEGTGGKIDLINAGVFDDVDLAMMFHPGFSTEIHVQSLALHSFEFIFHGKTAHAASEPWDGINALDAVIQTFNAINALRQQVRPDARIHGIIKEGGLATNIIPDRAVAEFCVRSEDNDYLEKLTEQVRNCAKGAAMSTGTRLEIKKVGHSYEAMKSNRVLGDIFKECLDSVGYVDPSQYKEGMGSIDMGNVSNVVPAIHPVLSLTDQFVPGHTVEFAEMCNTDNAYETMLLAANAMALTGLEVVKNKELQEEIRAEFAGDKKDSSSIYA